MTTPISFTAADVEYISGGTELQTRTFNAGATITAGAAVALDSSSLWQLADADDTAILAGSLGYGIALNGAADGQPLVVVTGSGAVIDFGTQDPTVLKQWETYIIDETAGSIVKIGELTTGWYTTILGYAQTTSELVFTPLLIPGARTS